MNFVSHMSRLPLCNGIYFKLRWHLECQTNVNVFGNAPLIAKQDILHPYCVTDTAVCKSTSNKGFISIGILYPKN